MGVIRGLTEVGESVPGDISVVGFDDHPLAAMWNPPLTTVRQDFANHGVRAFDLREGLLSDQSSKRCSSALPPLVIRESASARPR